MFPTLVGCGQPGLGPCSRLTPAVLGAIQPPEAFAESKKWTRGYVGRCRPPRSQTLYTGLLTPPQDTSGAQAALFEQLLKDTASRSQPDFLAVMYHFLLNLPTTPPLENLGSGGVSHPSTGG